MSSDSCNRDEDEPRDEMEKLATYLGDFDSPGGFADSFDGSRAGACAGEGARPLAGAEAVAVAPEETATLVVVVEAVAATDAEAREGAAAGAEGAVCADSRAAVALDADDGRGARADSGVGAGVGEAGFPRADVGAADAEGAGDIGSGGATGILALSAAKLFMVRCREAGVTMRNAPGSELLTLEEASRVGFHREREASRGF
ncbi:hypothetical protein B0J13DRAFT_239279 [Dactylonectria estremocensis]|uniref:Uncharacterized protein n=1 Tax=Dactylonectria estremocensis TaxID=1079267 RepID=A0A9P9D838_9HYPO|nr:hypothetical protein B0J13DRAFT_239279 [Dactylonectria estremocensis]